MCLINKCNTYIKQLLKQDVLVRKLTTKEMGKIPLTVNSNYDFYHSVLFGQEVLMLIVKDTDAMTPLQMEKHKEWVAKALGGVVVMVMESLPSYNAHRLMQRRVNFIVPGKQMFIPELLLDVRREAAQQRVVKVIPPMAQVMLLWQLERGGLEGLTTREVADCIGVTQPTMYRSMNWLSEHELLQLRSEKEKKVHFTTTGAELWEMVLKVCVSPIERVLFTDDEVEGIKAGEEALSELSMLNGEGVKTRAMTREQMKTAGLSVDARYGEHRIEVWRYDPKILAEGDVVDALSLYLAMKDSQDDRVQIELDQLIGGMPW